MKYIMMVNEKDGRKFPVIFPDSICHDDMALYFAEALRTDMAGLRLRAVSAGFINMHAEATHGKSVTLGLDADSGDAATINRYDYFYGLE